MNYLILKILSFVNLYYPKKDNQLLFISSPDLTDNSFAFFKYLIENRKKYTFVWLVDSVEKIELYKKMISSYISLEHNKSIRIYYKKSLKGMFSYIRSKYVFFTHGFYTGIAVSKNQIRVNLWHGMPLKAIGYLNQHSNCRTIPQSTYVIATSKIYQEIMAKVFNVKQNSVLVSGQPKCDLFFEKKNTLEKFNILRENYKKIIFWAPTFRYSKDKRIQDGDFDKTNILLNENNLKRVNSSLIHLNSYMIIKIHPMDILNKNDFKKYSNLLVIKDDQLLDKSIQLYSLLSEIDILITDFSSIYIDFLLLNRPIIFAISDFKNYQETRSFIFEEPKKYMPGKVVSDIDELIVELKTLIKLNLDNYFNHRKKILERFHSNKNHFSQRLLEMLEI